ncbi:NYN domain-containing protein [Burkholderia ubonensis]|nr:NYN domain-containing protein [Burkholderia ubonensis]KVQ92362.1 NYN domain-containing protein [Burkholderia ubonensis]
MPTTTAILIDGAYFIKRFRAIEPQNAHNAERAADLAHRWACKHLTPPNRRNGGAGAGAGAPARAVAERREERNELYRIFFYDCPPFTKRMHNPISRLAINFAESPEAKFRLELHERLRAKRKVALRLGHLSTFTQWTIKPPKIQDLIAGRITMDDITADDVALDFQQKGVDMRIGVDVSSLAFKKQVNQIVLIAGDADFVPAAKQARREGIDFILDPMWKSIPANLNEHIDGLRSTCPQVTRRPAVPGATPGAAGAPANHGSAGSE